MTTLSIILTLLAAPVGLYSLFVAWTAVRLAVFAKRLARDCAPRGWRLDWSYELFFPSDWEDPILLEVRLHRGGRELSFPVFRSLLSVWRPRSGTLAPLALSERLGASVRVERKDGRDATENVHVRAGREEIVEIGDAATDAHYTFLRTKGARAGEDLALLRGAFGRAEVRELLEACTDSLTLYGGRLTLRRTPRDDGDFFDWLDRATQLADRLDEVVTTDGPYR